MALSDLAVFSEYTYEAQTEVLTQQIDLFNAASQGTLLLRTQEHQGDFADTAFWAKISGLVRRRNACGSGAVAEKVLQHLVDTMVKVAAGTPPVRADPGMLNWIKRSPEEAGAVYGKQLAVDTLADMLNTAIMCYVAAQSGEASVYTDDNANTPTLAKLMTLSSKFGDRSSDIRAWVMHSKSMFDIFGTALANTAGLFTFGNVNVRQDGFGRPFVVTDSPALIGASTKYFIAGLVQGAVQVDMNNDFDQNVDVKNGDENIIKTIQSEWSYNLGIKGKSWDKTNGGKSPNDAALATATNWDRYATSSKDLAGVLGKFA